MLTLSDVGSFSGVVRTYVQAINREYSDVFPDGIVEPDPDSIEGAESYLELHKSTSPTEFSIDVQENIALSWMVGIVVALYKFQPIRLLPSGYDAGIQSSDTVNARVGASLFVTIVAHNHTNQFLKSAIGRALGLELESYLTIKIYNEIQRSSVDAAALLNLARLAFTVHQETYRDHATERVN